MCDSRLEAKVELPKVQLPLVPSRWSNNALQSVCLVIGGGLCKQAEMKQKTGMM